MRGRVRAKRLRAEAELAGGWQGGAARGGEGGCMQDRLGCSSGRCGEVQ